jgi:hypothetical protein
MGKSIMINHTPFRHSRSLHGQNLKDFGHHAAVWNNKRKRDGYPRHGLGTPNPFGFGPTAFWDDGICGVWFYRLCHIRAASQAPRNDADEVF